MLRRSTRIAVEVVIGFLAGVSLLMGMAVWRLSKEPLRLDFLTPYLENTLASNDNGVRVEVGETVLIWADWSRTLDIRAREVVLRDPKGYTIATLPDVSVNLSLRAMFRGIIAPTEIEIIGARLTLVRWSDGRFDFGLRQTTGETEELPEQAENDLSGAVPGILRQLLSGGESGNPLSYLEIVRVVGGSLTVVDRMLLTVWRAPSATIEVRRDVGGFSGGMQLILALANENTGLDFTFRYDKTSDLTDVVAQFADLDLESLVSLIPAAEPLQGLKVALSGTVNAVLSAGGRFQSLSFDLNGGTGSLVLPQLLAEPRPLRGLQVRGRLEGPAQRLEIEDAALHFDAATQLGHSAGPTLRLTAVAVAEAGDLKVDLTLEGGELPVNDLPLYWPVNLAESGREWVARNIRAGFLEDARLKAALRVPAGDFARAELESLVGGYSYRELEVHYLRPMPPATAVTGKATFDQTRMIFDATGGGVGEIDISEIDIKIVDFDKEDQKIDIDLSVSAPLDQGLALLDHKKLQLVSRLGLDPSDTAGQVAGRVEFKFPLINELTFEEIEITAKADLQKVSIKKVLFDRDAEDGQFKLALDKSGITVTGPVKLGQVPAMLKWRENFDASNGPRSLFDVKVDRIDEADLSTFGLDVGAYVTGPLSAALLATLNPDRSGRLDAVLDLRHVGLSIPYMLWQKASGATADLKFSVDLIDSRMTEIHGIDLRADNLSFQGRGRFDETGGDLAWLELEDVAVGKTRLSRATMARKDGSIELVLGAGVLDAAPIMEITVAPSSRATPEETPESQPPLGPLKFSAPSLDRVIFAEGRYLENVSLDFERSAAGWEVMFIDARIPRALWTESSDAKEEKGEAAERRNAARRQPYPGDKSAVAEEQGDATSEEPAEPKDRRFRMTYHRVEPNDYRYEATTDDTGALLRALDVRDTVKGGRMHVTGRSDGPMPKHDLKGRIDIDDYTLVGAPALAEILTVASFTGLMDTLSGNGIWFEKLESDFTLTDGVVRTDLLHAYGAAIGITAKGEVNLDESRLDLEGTVVPAYTINSFLNWIPGLGWLLTGGEGEGVLAFTYSLKGPLADPKASVNPLSVLAPGFLRKLFGVFDGETPTVFPEGPTR